MKQAVRYFVLATIFLSSHAPVSAYLTNGRWATTASGSVGPIGTPVILTWSIVPDGTNIRDLDGSYHESDLIATLDSWFGSGPGGTDYRERPWFTHIEQSFARWEQLGGVTFIYQAADDGVDHGTLQGNSQRGDIRLGGTNLDYPAGAGGAFGSSWFVPNADLTIDTVETTHFTNLANNHRNFRNTVTHEIGHALGLAHITSSNANFLMEGLFNNTYDGPQCDDIRGLQYQYGDIFEKSNDGAGNGTIANSHDLLTLTTTSSIVVGADGTTGTGVSILEDKFVSISNSNDLDFYSFTIANPSLVNLVLTPVGPTYSQSGIGSINSASISNLALQLYAIVDESPSLLASANVNPVGGSESILNFPLEEPGEYFVRVSGSSADVQLYTLSLSATELDLGQPGDFDGDSDVDGRDFLAWQRGETTPPHDADLLQEWQEHFGEVDDLTASLAVPEPTSAIFLLSALFSAVSFGRRS